MSSLGGILPSDRIGWYEFGGFCGTGAAASRLFTKMSCMFPSGDAWTLEPETVSGESMMLIVLSASMTTMGAP